MNNILLLEDDKSLNRGISFKLKKEGYNIFSAFTVEEAKDIFEKNELSLIISDVGLPDGSGFDFCEDVRKISDVFIIMLTALDEEVDIVTGYELGADDYITKPFSLMVLMSKVNAFMRRVKTVSSYSKLVCDDMTFDYMENKLIKNITNIDSNSLSNEEIVLSKTESKLLKHLMENAQKTITKEGLLEALWDIDGNFVDDNTVAVNIRRLRQKVEKDPSKPIYIKNIRGLGYTWTVRCLKKC
ncbi:DNA-binding response regulator [Romboutsia weinsteinii]|uniref:Stage 0 sporulation protein A homolog n=1 Tax=Romboutsia weinsteinii TaxID=2020949 RepID=A0A371JA72_9FIRM|nr:response regulator transcription factor [Romboutsia weinsteinii]RDY29654.1 DNA-binding response regulator [Romboutsia weinsteinii]